MTPFESGMLAITTPLARRSNPIATVALVPLRRWMNIRIR